MLANRLGALRRLAERKGDDAFLDGLLLNLSRESFSMPFMAHVRDYVPEGAEGEERERGLAALHAADAEAEAENRAALRRALTRDLG